MQEKKRRHGCKITEEEREAGKNKIENKWTTRGKPRKRNSLRKKINLLNERIVIIELMRVQSHI